MNKDALIRTMKEQCQNYLDITTAIMDLHNKCFPAIDEYNNETSLKTRFGTIWKPFVVSLFDVPGLKDECKHLELVPEKESEWTLIRERVDVQTLIEEVEKGRRNCDYVKHQLEVITNATRWWRDKLAGFKAGRQG